MNACPYEFLLLSFLSCRTHTHTHVHTHTHTHTFSPTTLQTQLNMDQFVRAISDHLSGLAVPISRIFQVVDVDGSGRIDYVRPLVHVLSPSAFISH